MSDWLLALGPWKPVLTALVLPPGGPLLLMLIGALLLWRQRRRTGWSAYVLNLPGKVLVQLGEKNPVVLDPFAGGAVLSAGQVAAVYRASLGQEGGAAALSAVRMSNRDVLARLLNNQGIRAEQEKDRQRALIIYQRITKVAPERLDAWQNLARLQLEFRDVEGAKASLFAMSEVAPEKRIRDRIMDAFEALT